MSDSERNEEPMEDTLDETLETPARTEQDIQKHRDAMLVLEALIPEPVIIAIVRAANVEMMETTGDEVLFPLENITALEAEAQEDEEHDPLPKEGEELLDLIRRDASKTAREINPDISEDLVHDNVIEVRNLLVTAWIQSLWSCASNSRSNSAFLGDDLLPLQRDDFLVEHQWHNWQDVLAAQCSSTIPREAVLWIYRVFAERLKKLVNAACDKDPHTGYVASNVDGKHLVIHRGTRSPYKVLLRDPQ